MSDSVTADDFRGMTYTDFVEPRLGRTLSTISPAFPRLSTETEAADFRMDE